MQKMKTIWVYHNPKELGIHILELWQLYLDLHRAGYQHFPEIKKKKRFLNLSQERKRAKGCDTVAESQRLVAINTWVSASRFATDLTEK